MLELVLNGAILSGLIMCLVDAVMLFRKRPSETKGVLFEKEKTKLNFENDTVTYYYLPEEEKENIKNGTGAILSGVVAVGALFLEFVTESGMEITLYRKVLYTVLIGIVISLLIDVAKKVLSYAIIKAKEEYAKRRGLVRELPDKFSKEY